jgi:hypothetical protein
MYSVAGATQILIGMDCHAQREKWWPLLVKTSRHNEEQQKQQKQ